MLNVDGWTDGQTYERRNVQTDGNLHAYVFLLKQVRQKRIWFLFSANCLIVLYICTKFHENISKGFRVTELTQFLVSKFSKRHRFIENIGGVMILVLNTFSDHALYLYKVS